MAVRVTDQAAQLLVLGARASPAATATANAAANRKVALDVLRDHPVRLIEGRHVRAPARLGHRRAHGRRPRDGMPSKKLRGLSRGRGPEAVFPGRLRHVDERDGRSRESRSPFEKRFPLATSLEEGLDLLVRVTLGVRRDHDEGLPVPVVTAIGQEVEENLPRAHDEAALVVTKAHAKREVQDRVEAATEDVAFVSLATDRATPALHHVDPVIVELAPQPEEVLRAGTEGRRRAWRRSLPRAPVAPVRQPAAIPRFRG